MQDAVDKILHTHARLEQNKQFSVISMEQLYAYYAEDCAGDIDDAKVYITENQSRGFTGQRMHAGHIFILDGEHAKHDAIHEATHCASATNGQTKIMQEYGATLNEGFTELFAIEACRSVGVPSAPAYEIPLEFVKRLEEVVGIGVLIEAYLQDEGMEVVVNALAAVWRLHEEELAAKYAKFSEQRFIPDNRGPADEVIRELLKADQKWRTDGPRDPMWSVLLQLAPSL